MIDSQSDRLIDLSRESLFFFDDIPVAAVIADPVTQRVLRTNPAARSLFGNTHVDHYADYVPFLLEARGAITLPKLMWRDGSPLLVEVTSKAILWQGQEARLFFILERVERNRTEQRLRDDLANAESSLKSKTDFLSTMSQQIRTPLAGVMGMAALLAETELTSEQREYLTAISSSGEVLFTVVNDILDYTKLEEQKLSLESLDFEIRELIEDVLDIAGVGALKKGVSLQSAVTENVPVSVRGDSARLKQVMLTLLLNAVKCAEAGSILLSAAYDVSASKLHIEVSGTGTEFAANAQENLFESFSQIDLSTVSEFGGSGLGLVICKRLVNMMGGEIGVVSATAKGSRFWFTAALPASRIQPVPEKPEKLKGCEVLLVQRNLDERESTRDLLAGMGLVVTEAANAPQALSVCSQRPESKGAFTFCLTDYNLPVIDGIKFAGLLRGQHVRNQGTKILLLTPMRASGQVSDAKGAGITEVLAKPLRKRLLLRSLLSVLGPAGGAGKSVGDPSGARAKIASILVIEDNAVNQLVATLCLKKLGYEVEVAEDGIAGVEAFANKSFDLILMDCHMPRMDGPTAAMEIRSMNDSGQKVPILALTADVMPLERDRCLASGMNDILYKPIHMPLLKSKLEYWLAKTV